MTQYSKFNIVYRLQKWMDSVPGQTFLNYAYSWGASIVILGTLFKLTHLSGANVMLFLGMGTEVFVFFLSAFDRPFDKTEEGKELPTHVYEGDEIHENASAVGGQSVTQPISFGGQSYVVGQRSSNEEGSMPVDGGAGIIGNANTPVGGGSPVAGGGIIINGGGFGSGRVDGVSGDSSVAAGAEESDGQNANTSSILTSEQIAAAAAAANQTAWIQQQQQVSPEMEEATNNYVDELKKLTEMLSKVSEQSERLTRDSEEMENLNRTLTGICKIYEMQLKGASAQVGTIDQINEQSRKMAGQIEQLNKIYARMIEAMTVNMKAATPAASIDNE